MAVPQPPSPPAGRGDFERGGLSGRERWLIAAILFAGVVLAGLLMFAVPLLLVSEQDYRCSPTSLSAACLGPDGADGIDDQALSQARAAARTSFGVLSAGLLAGAAAAIGVVVSNHNAALTRATLNATIKTNEITKSNNESTSARESTRDHDTAARERERAADERFTTAIGQLGHPSASVRLGGMHSLHRLAESHPERLPTVVDVLCAYLRQPFHHPDHDWRPSEHASDAEPPALAWRPADPKERDERDSEREVRSTATRLIPTLLPLAGPYQTGVASQSLEINLNGAMLDSLDLSGRSTGRLRLNGAHISGDLRLVDGVRIDGDLQLGFYTHITGSLRLDDDAHITGDLLLAFGAHIDGDLRLGSGVRIDGDFLVGVDAYVTGDLWLGHGVRIGGELQFGPGADVRGGLVATKTAVARGVRLDQKAARTRDWFRGWDVPFL